MLVVVLSQEFNPKSGNSLSFILCGGGGGGGMGE